MSALEDTYANAPSGVNAMSFGLGTVTLATTVFEDTRITDTPLAVVTYTNAPFGAATTLATVPSAPTGTVAVTVLVDVWTTCTTPSVSAT